MGWTFLDELIDITSYITGDGTWRTTSTITELPSGTTVVWLRVRQNSATAYAVAATHPDITSTYTKYGHVNKPQYFMIGVKDRTLRYYCSDVTYQFWEILAYSDNANEAVTTVGAYPIYTPTPVGSYITNTFTELQSNHTFAALLVPCGSNAVLAACRDSGTSYDHYHRLVPSGFTTRFCPITNKVGELKISNTDGVHVLSAGFVGTKITPTGISIPNTGWTTIDASGVFPSGANIAILEVRNSNTSSARVCALRNTGSTDNITAGVNITSGASDGAMSQFRLVGLNASRQFDINVNNTIDVNCIAWGYISNERILRLADYWHLTVGMLNFDLKIIIKINKRKKSMYVEIERD